MAESIPVIVENGVVKPLRKIKRIGKWRGELRLLEEIPSQSEEIVEGLRTKILQDFENNFPGLKFDLDLLSLIGADYALRSVPEEDKLLLMDYLEEKYADT